VFFFSRESENKGKGGEKAIGFSRSAVSGELKKKT
jgi:hypothetical protein